LQWVAEHPKQSREATLDVPVWELVARVVFHIANHPDRKVRGSMGRATAAQKIILDRLVGRRRPGTHPAQASSEEIEFADLTVGVLEDAAKAAEQEAAQGEDEGLDDDDDE